MPFGCCRSNSSNFFGFTALRKYYEIFPDALKTTQTLSSLKMGNSLVKIDKLFYMEMV